MEGETLTFSRDTRQRFPTVSKLFKRLLRGGLLSTVDPVTQFDSHLCYNLITNGVVKPQAEIFDKRTLSDQGQVTWSAAATGLPLCNRSHRLFPHRTHTHLFTAIINTGELNQNGSPLLLLIGRHLSTHAGVVIPLVVSSPDFTAKKKKKRQKMVKGIGVTSKWR